GAFTGWLDLKAAPLSVSVVFTRRGDEPARLRTLWQKEGAGDAGFAPEMIPVASVAVPSFAAREAAASDSAFRGRVLLGELNCTACHAAGEARAAVVTQRRGPLLGEIGKRADGAFLLAWVRDPQGVKPGCGMPGVIGDDPSDRTDAE